MITRFINSSKRSLGITLSLVAAISALQACQMGEKGPDPLKVSSKVVTFSAALPEKYKLDAGAKNDAVDGFTVTESSTGTVIGFSRSVDSTGGAKEEIVQRMYQEDGFLNANGEKVPVRLVDNFKMLIGGKEVTFLNGTSDPGKKNQVMVGYIRPKEGVLTNIYFLGGKSGKVDMAVANDLCNRIVTFN